MLRIKKGGTYTAERVESGATDSKPWRFAIIKEGMKSAKFWFDNGKPDIRENDEFTVTEITDVRQWSKEYKGKWYDQLELNGKAELVAIGSERAPETTHGRTYAQALAEAADDDLPL